MSKETRNDGGPKMVGPGAGSGMPVKKPKDMGRTIKRLFGYLEKHKFKMFLVILMIILSSAASTAATRIVGIAIDEYIAPGNMAGLSGVIAVLFAAYIMVTIFTWLQSYIMINVAQQSVAEIRKDIFDKFQQLPLSYFDTQTHGDLMSRVTNDVDNISQMLNNSVAQIFSSFLTIIMTVGMMLYLSPIMTLATLITIPVFLYATSKITSKSRVYYSEKQKKLGNINGYVEEVISGQKVVKVFTREGVEMEKFGGKNNSLLEVSLKAEIFAGIAGPISSALKSVNYALIAASGGLMITLNKGITVGIISNFMVYSNQITRPLNELANQINMIMSAIAGAERVFEVMDQENEPEDVLGAAQLVDIKGEVVLTGVNFSYKKDHPVLKNIDLYALPGQTIAFVGPTGAGKTTIINLLTRFYDIDSGSITIDGIELKNIKRNSLRNSLGIVLQDTYLFTGTIRDNIKYGRLDATDEEMKEASKLANSNEFIKRLPNGYDTILTDGGGNLSQGQRQMISIARAILSDPAILILDEATSNVDTRTEVKIQEAMHNLMHGRTNFVIAHRLSTIKDADLIAVVNNGEIIERGNHDQLIEKQGFYYNLYTSQFALPKEA